MKFCTQCGKKLEDWETCDCTASKQDTQNFGPNQNPNFGQNQNFNQNQNFGPGSNQNFGQNNYKHNQNQNTGNNYSNDSFDMDDFTQRGKDIFDGMSKNVGNTYQKIRDERQRAQERERAYVGSPDDLIIPHSMSSNDGEIPVKQFNLTTLRNLTLGIIPMGKAMGKLLITNKRVIFSAKGFDFNGSTNYQQEFTISEIGGVKFRKSYSFKFLRFLLIFMLSTIVTGIIAAIFYDLFDGSVGSKFLSLLSKLSVLAAGFVLFFPGINKWLKLLATVLAMSLSSTSISGISDMFLYGGYSGDGKLDTIIGFIKLILLIVAIVSVSKLPDMEILVATKGGGEAVMVKADKKGLGLFRPDENNCGYSYVLPARDTEIAIREVGAIIDDIQVLGDYGVDKWKQI